MNAHDRDKLPYYAWYPGDWRKDMAVQSLSYHYRGIWRELLDMMWESEDRGRLVLNGKPISDASLARLLGLPVSDTTNAIAVLLVSGVASRDAEGALFNRRMVRDEAIRQVRSAAGRKGGLTTVAHGGGGFASHFASSKSGSKDGSKPLAKPKQNPDSDNENDSGEKKIRERLAAIFARRQGTAWSDKEFKSYVKIIPVDEDELAMVERYYAAERKRPDNVCRRDLLTLLNNWPGEVDRARAWCAKHPLPGARTVKPKQAKPLEPPADDWENPNTPENKSERQRVVRELTAKLTGGIVQ